MAIKSSTGTRGKCLSCGFDAAAGSEEWETAQHPSLGMLTKCPDCGSTNVTSRG